LSAIHGSNPKKDISSDERYHFHAISKLNGYVGFLGIKAGFETVFAASWKSLQSRKIRSRRASHPTEGEAVVEEMEGRSKPKGRGRIGA
jgi:hypothetical protein